jgi:hypothetical protein
MVQSKQNIMTQTTYSTIEVDSKFWLAPEPVMEKPEFNSPCYVSGDSGEPLTFHTGLFHSDTEAYNLWKSGWIEIKEEHTREFKGRTELVKDVHFEVVHEYLIHERWVRTAHFKNLIEQERTVAVPIGEVDAWKLELRRMRTSDEFDDKFDTKTLEFVYAFQMGFRAAQKSNNY